jgi:formate-dependent nitrite reductase cytochrome c552 subunit
MNQSSINDYQRARNNVEMEDFRSRMARLEADLAKAECRKTASLIREAQRSLKWEFGVVKASRP